MKSDIQLQNDVMEEIKWDPLLSSIATDIGVSAHEGVITLSGQIDSFGRKHALERAAQRVSGVTFVALDLEVKISSEFKRSDTEIAKSIKALWSQLEGFNTEGLDVRVEDGWVKVEGTVQWNYQRKMLEEWILDVDGVRGVDNKIQLSQEPCDARTVTEKINAAFHRHATIDAANVHVEVKDRTAILTGKVRSWTEKKDAENSAWSSPGIVSVVNEITVDNGEYVG